MNKKANMSPEQLSALLKAAAKTTGTDINAMKSAVESGNINSLLGALRPEDSEKVQKILSDKGAAEKLLSTPQAQELLKKIMGGGK